MNTKPTVQLPEGIVVTTDKPSLKPGMPWTGYIHPKHIKANPTQPRETFLEEDQESLQGSHCEVGQQKAISVIPYEDSKNPNIWFMIHDGERSWRSLTKLNGEAVLVLYNPIVTEQNLDFLSFAANFGRKGHTHCETIKAVWKEIRDKDRSVEDFAKAVTRSTPWVYQYLSLHNLHPELKPLLDPPTPKNDRLSMTLALLITKADVNEQFEIYKKTKDLSNKSAIRTAQTLLDSNDSQGVRKRNKPSVNKRLLNRIIRTTAEDFEHLSGFSEEDFDDMDINLNEFTNSLQEMVAHIGVTYEKLTGVCMFEGIPSPRTRKGSAQDEVLEDNPKITPTFDPLLKAKEIARKKYNFG